MDKKRSAPSTLQGKAAKKSKTTSTSTKIFFSPKPGITKYTGSEFRSAVFKYCQTEWQKRNPQKRVCFKTFDSAKWPVIATYLQKFQIGKTSTSSTRVDKALTDLNNSLNTEEGATAFYEVYNPLFTTAFTNWGSNRITSSQRHSTTIANISQYVANAKEQQQEEVSSDEEPDEDDTELPEFEIPDLNVSNLERMTTIMIAEAKSNKSVMPLMQEQHKLDEQFSQLQQGIEYYEMQKKQLMEEIQDLDQKLHGIRIKQEAIQIAHAKYQKYIDEFAMTSSFHATPHMYAADYQIAPPAHILPGMQYFPLQQSAFTAPTIHMPMPSLQTFQLPQQGNIFTPFPLRNSFVQQLTPLPNQQNPGNTQSHSAILTNTTPITFQGSTIVNDDNTE